MSILKRLVKSFQVLMRELLLLPSRLSRWLTRRFFRSTRRNTFRHGQAGFILPTVVMVILVVTLLTTTIVFRSFDRAKNASNVRVNQVVLNAALPAIERATAKIEAVFADPTLPQGTPTDTAITNAFNNTNYDLGDEVRLRLAADFNGQGGIQTDFGTTNNDISPTDEEVMTTAWRFPVDTDNNGRFDSFTLYGIYYRSPSSGSPRARTTLEARTPPQDDSATSQACATASGTSASLTGAEGWYKIGGTLKKGFYVYTTTVPILDRTANILPTSGTYDQLDLYENYQGNRGFSGLEYQQDRSRIPLGNNAVVYEDDLELFVGATRLNLNGRIVANSNFNSGFVRNPGGIRLYQVSSDESCFYEAENGKIFVGGNVSHGQIGSDRGNINGIQVDLYEEGGDPTSIQSINSTNESTNQTANEVAYNTQAYEERIDLLVRSAIANVSIRPQAIEDEVTTRFDEPDNAKTMAELLEEEYTSWFRQRTRRVPFGEVPFGDSGTQGLTINDTVLEGINSNLLRPIERWHYPVDPNTGLDGVNMTALTLRTNQLAATDPAELGTSEERLGDRVLVGNNLPEKWLDSTGNFSTDESQQPMSNVSWTNNTVQRYRFSRVTTLDDLGDISRDGFWEKAAAKLPENRFDGYGGLRVVTGAGIYMPLDVDLARVERLGDLNNPNDDTVSRVIWPDTMPVIPYTANENSGDGTNYYNLANIAPWLGEKDDNTNSNPDTLDDENGNPRPFLRMRASAVYHYTYDNDNFDENTPAPPIACVSSFYDPTDTSTARNRSSLGIDVSGDLAWQTNAIAAFTPPNTPPGASIDPDRRNSNNGITYALPLNVDGGLANNSVLRYQAQLVYPNGRLVNPQLAKALDDLNTGGVSGLSFPDRAAIDSALCALQILAQQGVNTTFAAIAPNENPTGRVTIPHGTIQEVAFVDTREVKAIEGNDNTCGGNNCDSPDNNYDNQPIRYSRVLDTPDLTTPNNMNCNTNDCISQYDLAVELRQPLEVRATAIDLDTLRRQQVNTPYVDGPDPEYLFPNGGIIYASRDDALPDASDRPADPAYNRDGTASGLANLYDQELGSDKVSPTDFWLDPTRRPNGILLINGSSLGRAGSNAFSDQEKGLILVSNNPVYIKGGFNLHTGGSGEEFNERLNTTDWSNFYTRSAGNNGADFNKNFACRVGDPRLTTACNPGDEWRQATILSDTITLLTSDYRFGFRSDGDFDLRNNQTDNLFRNITVSTLNPDPANTNIPAKSRDEIDKARRDNGFWDNTFVTNGLSSDNTTGVFGTNTGYTDQDYGDFNREALGSTYFNNGMLPIQRRKRNNNGPSEYVMEICRKLPVSNCQPGDWVIGYNWDGGDLNGSFTEADISALADINGDGISGDASASGRFQEKDITSEQLLRITEYTDVDRALIGSGTTALAPLEAIDQHYARRVAFKRNNGNLELIDASNAPVPIPLGIDLNNRVAIFKYQLNAAGGVPTGNPGQNTGNIVAGVGNVVYNGRPKNEVNGLWFRGSDETDGEMWNGIDNNDYTNADRWLSFLEPTPAVGTRDAYLAGYFDERDDWLLPDIDFFINGTGTDQGDIANNLNNPSYRANYLNEYEQGLTPTLANLVGQTTDPVDYSVCINGAGGGQAQNLYPTVIGGGGCNVDTTVDRFLDTGVYVISDTINPDGSTVSGSSLGDVVRPHKTFEDLTVTDNDSGRILKVFTYSLANTTPIDVGDGASAPTSVDFNYLGDPANPVTLTLNGDSDTMFIFRFDRDHPVLFENVRMILNGVNPNNIFWVVRDNDGGAAGEGGIVFAGTNFLAGNFLGRSNDNNAIMFDTTGVIRATNISPSAPTNTTITGGRFLGFNGTGGILGQPLADFNTAAGAELTFNAITTSHQPLLVPVLQIHAFQNNNAPPTISRNNNSNAVRQSNWVQRAADTINTPEDGTFNLVMATGDSPARFRPNTPQVLEANGSFSNLVRTQENWYVSNTIKRPLTIRGSFIQLQRSAYGTAPHWQVIDPYTDENPNNDRNSLLGYAQTYSLNSNRNNTYDPPDRQWGFDVGILSQSPDLFSQRFTLPPTDDPNEYYREVGRNDPWIETLLCGNLANPNGSLAGRRAVNDEYRTNCPE